MSSKYLAKINYIFYLQIVETLHATSLQDLRLGRKGEKSQIFPGSDIQVHLGKR